MDEELGLAGSYAQAAMGMGMPQDAASMGQSTDEVLIDEVINALLQGVTPEELISQGVPEDIIEIALSILEASMGGAGVAQPEQLPI